MILLLAIGCAEAAGTIYFGLIVIGLAIAFVVPTIAVVGTVLWSYFGEMRSVLFQGSGEPEHPRGREPAYKQYYFHQAWVDYGTIVGRSYRASHEAAVKSVGWVSDFFNSKGKDDAWLHVVLGFFGALLGGAFGLVTFAAFGALHLAILSACAIVAITLAYLFRMIEFATMQARRIFLVCPHSGCHRRMALPLYLCPTCNAEHARLIPGAYGTFHRRCRCGASLPTLPLFGRRKLPSLCPHPACRRPLNAALGSARNLHFPLVGGPTAGKTTLLMATMVELQREAGAGHLDLRFPEDRDARLFKAAADAYGRGALLSKTADYDPTAFLVRLGDRRGASALLYVYDAAGELYAGTDQLRGQQFFAHAHGIALVVDPYSLPVLRDRAGPVPGQMSWSAEQIEAVLGRMLEVLRGFTGSSGRLRLPLAVVLTKCDGPGLSALLAHAGGTAADSDEIRGWLEQHGEGNLVRTIDREFATVRYFACSALGRVPDGRPQGFSPRGVMPVYAWLFGHFGVDLESAA